MSLVRGTCTLIALTALLFCASSFAANYIEVIKSERTLTVYQDDVRIASFPVVFGSNSMGHKAQEGDGRTPEGVYQLIVKNPKSHYYRSIRISYPNRQDVDKANALGVSAGGDIMIHGQPNGFGWLSGILQQFNWTQGCIALNNDDMDALWALVMTPVDIIIKP